jgi:hypothetical protein
VSHKLLNSHNFIKRYNQNYSMWDIWDDRRRHDSEREGEREREFWVWNEEEEERRGGWGQERVLREKGEAWILRERERM